MRLLLISILLFSNLFVNAAGQAFKLDGEIQGGRAFKYVYAFDNNYKLIAKTNIINQRFSLIGEHPEDNKFNELAFIKVLFSDQEEKSVNASHLSTRQHDQVTLFLNAQMNLNYDSDKKVFELSGGEHNILQNKFMRIQAYYRNQRDSVYQQIDTYTNTAEEKEKLKVHQSQNLFLASLQSMVKLCKENLDSEVAFSNFFPILISQKISGATVLALFEGFNTELKASLIGLRYKKDIEDKIRMEGLMASPAYKVGMIMPGFKLINEREEEVDAYKSLGKYTLIDFWATWCGPCRIETPNLIKAQALFKNQGFKIITVSIDELKDKEKWLQALKDDRMEHFINLYNGGDLGGLTRELKIVSIPANFLIDNKGIIVAKDLRGDALTLKLKELFD